MLLGYPVYAINNNHQCHLLMVGKDEKSILEKAHQIVRGRTQEYYDEFEINAPVGIAFDW